VLPADYVDEAIERCRKTIERGDGEPLDQRIAKMLSVYAGISVKVSQIETRVGRKRGQWTAADVAELGVVFQSIRKGETTANDEFPQDDAINAADLARTGPPMAAAFDGADGASLDDPVVA
jgi:hypothetical protein